MKKLTILGLPVLWTKERRRKFITTTPGIIVF